MYEPAGKVLVAGGRSAEAFALLSCWAEGFALLSWTSWAFAPPAPPDPPDPSLVVVGRGGVFFPGTVTVNAAVAREISTPCFCSTRSRSACAPGRGSSAVSTYAAGPSVFAFRMERLLFR